MGETVSFPVVITNIGGYYDPSESVFTCPLYGTYYFTFNLYSGLATGGYRTSAVIMRDQEAITEAYCQFTNINDVNLYQCGNSAVIQCSQGQQVYISVLLTGVQYEESSSSTFSGFLLHADIPPYEK